MRRVALERLAPAGYDSDAILARAIERDVAFVPGGQCALGNVSGGRAVLQRLNDAGQRSGRMEEFGHLLVVHRRHVLAQQCPVLLTKALQRFTGPVVVIATTTTRPSPAWVSRATQPRASRRWTMMVTVGCASPSSSASVVMRCGAALRVLSTLPSLRVSVA